MSSLYVRKLVENDALDDPSAIGMEHFTNDAWLIADVRDILDHAKFLREQAQQAGALSQSVIGNIPDHVINRALLRIACEELDDEVQVDTAIKRLKRNMASIWD
jgi:3-keto-L-gulonate-6-phosphate decarboxylase